MVSWSTILCKNLVSRTASVTENGPYATELRCTGELCLCSSELQ